MDMFKFTWSCKKFLGNFFRGAINLIAKVVWSMFLRFIENVPKCWHKRIHFLNFPLINFVNLIVHDFWHINLKIKLWYILVEIHTLLNMDFGAYDLVIITYFALFVFETYQNLVLEFVERWFQPVLKSLD